jgi:hypothetical protein
MLSHILENHDKNLDSYNEKNEKWETNRSLRYFNRKFMERW